MRAYDEFGINIIGDLFLLGVKKRAQGRVAEACCLMELWHTKQARLRIVGVKVEGDIVMVGGCDEICDIFCDQLRNVSGNWAPMMLISTMREMCDENLTALGWSNVVPLCVRMYAMAIERARECACGLFMAPLQVVGKHACFVCRHSVIKGG